MTCRAVSSPITSRRSGPASTWQWAQVWLQSFPTLTWRTSIAWVSSGAAPVTGEHLVEGRGAAALEGGHLGGRGGERVAAGLEGEDREGPHAAYIPTLSATLRICTPWTRLAPPRIAQATCTASVICSRSDPFCSAAWV